LLVHKSAEENVAKKSAAVKEFDPNVRAAETKLRRALGTQVKITQTAEGKGKIEISFFDTSDLDRLYNLIMPTTHL
jgi:hypothetical protein